jgi:hypothetical protein
MKVKNPRPSIDVRLRNGYEIDTRSRVRLLQMEWKERKVKGSAQSARGVASFSIDV